MPRYMSTPRNYRKRTFSRSIWIALSSLLIASSVSCDRKESTRSSMSDIPYRERMRVAVNKGEWEAAWAFSDKVLIESGNDPETLEMVALVAFNTDRKSEAADLLLESTRNDGLLDQDRFQKAFTGLIAAGRLFDAIDLLRDGVEVRPADSTFRRLLFDLLVATEQHREAMEHRQILIKARAIDGDLMFAANRYSKRNEEIDSLYQMLEKNPVDKRPLIGDAKKLFDQQNYDEAIAVLQEIIGAHSKFAAAQLMLGRGIVAAGKFLDLPDWASTLPGNIVEYPDFWLIIGDWAVQREESAIALNAYGVASQKGLDLAEPWIKLASRLAVHDSDSTDLPYIRKHAAALIRLRQGYAEFKDRSKESASAVTQIVLALVDLGLVWEAEAWAALGTTFPSLSEAEKQSLIDLRTNVLSGLKSDTPWQSPSNIPSWAWLEPIDVSTIYAKLQLGKDASSLDLGLPKVAGSLVNASSGVSIFPRLSDEAMIRGLNFHGRTADDLDKPSISLHESMGCGGGTIDFDLDGWPDLYLSSAGGTPPHSDSAPNAMFRNLNGRFTNVSLKSDGQDTGFGQGVAVGDVNEDGFDDLLVLNYGPNRLWINNGDGTFSDHTDHWLPDDSSWSTSAAIADIDGDGISDVLIANYCAGLGPVTAECFSAYSNTPRSCSPNHFHAESDFFLRGTSKGQFIDATTLWQATPELLGRGLGVVAGSFDSQPGIDLVVANDMTSNHYWSRRANAVSGDPFALEDSGSIRGLANDGQSRSQASMGIAVSDFNRDGVADFYVTNYEFEYNTLYVSRDRIGWTDFTSREGLINETLPMIGFGTQAIDFDNNGDEELIVTNGHVDHVAHVNGTVVYQQPGQLFQRNSRGKLQSIDVQRGSPYFQSSHVGRAIWAIDANRDGKVDVAITHQTEPTALLMNHTQTEHAFISLRLVAKQDSRNAIGSIVTVRKADGGSTYFLTTGNGYMCSNERFVNVGLGENDGSVDISVRWLNGDVQTWPPLQANQEWLLVQGESPFLLSGDSDE